MKKLTDELEKLLNDKCDLYSDNTWDWSDNSCFRGWKIIKRIPTNEIYSKILNTQYILNQQTNPCNKSEEENLQNYQLINNYKCTITTSSSDYQNTLWTQYKSPPTGGGCYGWSYKDFILDNLELVLNSGNSMWLYNFKLGLISGDLRENILVFISPEEPDFYAITGYEDIIKTLEENFIPKLIESIIKPTTVSLNDYLNNYTTLNNYGYFNSCFSSADINAKNSYYSASTSLLDNDCGTTTTN